MAHCSDAARERPAGKPLILKQATLPTGEKRCMGYLVSNIGGVGSRRELCYNLTL